MSLKASVLSVGESAGDEFSDDGYRWQNHVLCRDDQLFYLRGVLHALRSPAPE